MHLVLQFLQCNLLLTIYMNFQDLQIFLHLADTQNFAKTATQNYMSPSTLSRQIQRMEEELEQPLFIRDNRQVRLTKQGENFCNLRKQNGKLAAV